MRLFVCVADVTHAVLIRNCAAVEFLAFGSYFATQHMVTKEKHVDSLLIRKSRLGYF